MHRHTKMQRPFAECRYEMLPWLAARLKAMTATNVAAEIPPSSASLTHPITNLAVTDMPSASPFDYTGFETNPHPAAVEYMRQNPTGINWSIFCRNTSTVALEILRARMDYPDADIDWELLCGNENPIAGDIVLENWFQFGRASLQNNDSYIDSLSRSRNTKCLELFVAYLCAGLVDLNINSHKNMLQLCANPHPIAIELVKENLDKISMEYLCDNPHPWAQQYFRDHIVEYMTDNGHFRFEIVTTICPETMRAMEAADVFGNRYLDEDHDILDRLWSMNPHPEAIEYLKAHPDKIVLESLALNPHPWALEHMRKHFDEPLPAVDAPWDLQWAFTMLSNPGIFRDEYDDVARQYFREHIAAELMAHVWHPRNFAHFAALGEGIAVSGDD